MFKKIIVVLFPIFLFAQQQEHIILSADVEPEKINLNEKGVLTVSCSVMPEYHISGYKSGLFEVIPDFIEGFEFDEVKYPRGEEDQVAGNIYHGKIKVQIGFTVGKGATEGSIKIPVTVKYQACSEDGSVCYPPDSRRVATSIIVGTEIFSSAEDKAEGSITERLSGALEKGSIIAFLVVFLGGVLTSFTPCVYPMIPVTLAVIGAQAGKKKLKGFVLSLFYVLGIAVTFSILGIIAAKTGGMFGTLANHPAVLIFLSAVFLIMGLSMLGVFILQLPSSFTSRLQGKKKSGFVGVFLTGLVAGLVVSPCISPILVVILTWVARTGSIFMGISLLFTYALGLGVLFILIGTFSGILKALPKSGGWMEIIERGLGVILVILAIVFIKSILPILFYYMLWAVFFMLLGTFMGGFISLEAKSTTKQKLGKAFGMLLILIGSFLLFLSISKITGYQQLSVLNDRGSEAIQKVNNESFWFLSDEEGFKNSKEMNRPVLIDFFAQWCAACKELDEKTWSDLKVREILKQFVPIKLDLTKNDEEAKRVQKKYKVIGMPTVIIFKPSGKEILRFEGFKSPEEFLDMLDKYGLIE